MGRDTADTVGIDVEVRAEKARREYQDFLKELEKTYPTADKVKERLDEVEKTLKGLSIATDRNSKLNKDATAEYKKQQQGLKSLAAEYTETAKVETAAARASTAAIKEREDAQIAYWERVRKEREAEAKEAERQAKETAKAEAAALEERQQQQAAYWNARRKFEAAEAKEQERAAEAIAKATAKAGDPAQVQAAIDAQQQLTDTYAKQITTVRQADQAIAQLNFEIQAIRASEQANTDAGRAAISQRQQQVSAIRAIRDRLAELERQLQQTTREQEKQNKSIGALIKKSILWGAGTASLFYLYRRLRRAIFDVVKEMLVNTDEAEALNAASEDLKDTLDVMFGDAVRDAAREFAEILGDINDFFTELAIQQRVNAQLQGQLDQQVQDGTASFEAQASAAGRLYGGGGFRDQQRFAEALGDTADEYERLREEAEAYIEAQKEAARLRREEEQLLRRVASAAKTLADQYRNLAQAQREARATLDAAKDAYESGIAIAQGELAAGLLQIEFDLAKEIDKINADALDQREEAYADYQNDLTKIQKQGNKQRQDDEARHNLEMEFARRRHQLTQVQNERMYQYQRALLVAEGDVLAIEDLDARYELERKAQEENFQLQMQQAEAMFRLQARIQAEAMREQVKILQAALGEQLREIEKGRREEIAEAQEGAAEAKQAEKEKWADVRATLEAEYEDAKDEYQEFLDDQLEAQAEFLAQLIIDNKLGFDEFMTAYQDRYGTDGELARLTKDTYDEILRETNHWKTELTSLMRQAGEDAGRTFSESFINSLTLPTFSPEILTRGRKSKPSTRTVSRFQYGGEAIYSQPTMIEVGHGPERVTVQPLSPLGGHVSVGWRGGAIPIHGTGSFTGADMQAVGAAINQGLTAFASEYVSARSNVRGQRGN